MGSQSAGSSREPEYVLISALEHYSYCPRQCALIHVESIFDENIYTLKGRYAHERADTVSSHKEGTVRVERGLTIWSDRLELFGRADIVEFHGSHPYPVEYKVGGRRAWKHEALQVCAQALCLEEMLDCEVPKGAIYYCSSKERREIVFDSKLRSEVESAVQEIREMIRKAELPPAVDDKRCDECSLYHSCLPTVISKAARLRYYAADLFKVRD